MLAHLRTEAYPVYAVPHYPPVRRTAQHAAELSYERNNALIDAAKSQAETAESDRGTVTARENLRTAPQGVHGSGDTAARENK